MKRTTLLSSAGAVILGALSMNVSADEQRFVAADNSVGTQLCMAITKDSPLKLKKAMDYHRARTHLVVNDLQCNDLTVRQFASLYGFERSMKRLNITPLTETSIRDLAKVHGDKLNVVVGSK
ncbi:DUF3718 domain-containing protein [Pseudoalteromonas sp. SSDWG2]|uniref:DUF3718 domain-containing protein n=1 Tax=Pseudoalteromonas sp. SSDWG2 TaxID=3139391 RepID=UPI003BAD092B